MEQLDLWLRTYRVENRISPASWSELPDDLKLNLENLARDEAVRRADEFARDELLDLSLHDAVRQLVNAMAQAWTLPSGKVCEIVMDYIDQIPPDPGMEFDKLADIIFRRRTSATWAEINAAINTDNLQDIVTGIFESIAIAEQSTLDRQQFLKLLNEAYDSWCIEHPKEAVKEVFKLLGSGEKREKLSLETVKELIVKRGAEMWCSALDLELEVGVNKAGKEELTRILKRYALIRKREGGAGSLVSEQPAASANSDIGTSEIPPDDVIVENVEQVEDDNGEVLSEAVSDDSLIAAEEPGEVEFGSGLGPVSEMEAPDDQTESSESEPVLAEEPETEEQVGDEDLTNSDEEAIRELFGGDRIIDESEETGETEDRETEEPETASTEDVSENPEERNASSEAESEGAPGAEELLDEEAVAEMDNDEMFGSGNDLEPAVDESGQNTDDDILIQSDEQLLNSDEVDTETGETASEDELSGFDNTSVNRDEGVPQEESSTESFGVDDDLADPLDRLRTGEFRERLINELYNGSTASFESFIARLENAPDWNRAKQSFANELFRLRVDMETNSIADELFVILKRGFSGKG